MKSLFITLCIVGLSTSIFISKDLDEEDYPAGYGGLVGQYVPLEKIQKNAGDRIRTIVKDTLTRDNMMTEIPAEDLQMEFAQLSYMRVTGSFIKLPGDKKKTLTFGGLVNVTVPERNEYATVFIDHRGIGSVIAHIVHSSNNNNINKKSDTQLKFLSYNIWNYNGDWKARLSLLCDEMCSSQYDAVAIQELRYSQWNGDETYGRVQIEHIAEECRRRSGAVMNYIWQPAMTYAHHIYNDGEYEVEGVGILTKHPIVNTSRHFMRRSVWDSQDEHQRVLLASKIHTGGNIGDITFISTHFSLSDEMETSNAHEMHEFADSLHKAWSGPVVVMGDFNAEDSSNAYKYITSKEDGEFDDAWTKADKREGPENGFSWSRVPGDETTKRVDYCFYKNYEDDDNNYMLYPKMVKIPNEFPCSEVINDYDDRVCASDHLPLSVKFDVIKQVIDTNKDEL